MGASEGVHVVLVHVILTYIVWRAELASSSSASPGASACPAQERETITAKLHHVTWVSELEV